MNSPNYPTQGAKRMDIKASSQSILKLILIASIVSTAIHFIDNYQFIEQYPQPVGITVPEIDPV